MFWMETMVPHLHTLARALDELDDKYYVDFDTSDIPILIIAKQERERYYMDEFQQGLISLNEYREATGKKKVESELADSLLSNPNLTPIANTEKPFKTEEQQPVDMVGVDQGAPAGGLPPQEGAAAMPQPAPPAPIPAPEEGGVPAEGAPAGIETGALPPQQQLSEWETLQNEINKKFVEGVETKADEDTNRWTEILDRTLERLFERQQRVVTEKAFGKKALKAMENGTLTAEMFFDKKVWDKQLQDDVKPVIMAICNEGKDYVASRTNMPAEMDQEELERLAQEQIERMQQANQATFEEIAAAVLVALASGGEEDKSALLRIALAAIFINLLRKRRRAMAEHEAQSAFNAGVYVSGKSAGGLTKTWLTRKDPKVRASHAFLEGKTVDFGDGFAVSGSMLRFPGDPLAPPSLTYNCRCRLRLKFD